MKKIIITISGVLIVITAIVVFFMTRNTSTQITQIIPQSSNLLEGRKCYTYHQVATTDAPYAVDEYLDLTFTDKKVSGTKQGTQNGPDMTNGYIGSIDGTVDQDTISSIFSYTIEGSKGKEQELYKIVNSGLEKMRYPLIENKGVLVPDPTKEFKLLPYTEIDCSKISK